jgi:hypothetical protein
VDAIGVRLALALVDALREPSTASTPSSSAASPPSSGSSASTA